MRTKIIRKWQFISITDRVPVGQKVQVDRKFRYPILSLATRTILRSITIISHIDKLINEILRNLNNYENSLMTSILQTNLVWKLHKLLQVLITSLWVPFCLDHESNLDPSTPCEFQYTSWKMHYSIHSSKLPSGKTWMEQIVVEKQFKTKQCQINAIISDLLYQTVRVVICPPYSFIKGVDLMGFQIQNCCRQTLQELTHKRLCFSNLEQNKHILNIVLWYI